MKITFLGTGTSQGVPMIACDCAVCRSADKRDKRLRTSVLVEDQDFSFVIDTGPDFRYQMLRADVKKLDAILFTHEHKDHIAGLDDIRAFNFKHNYDMPVYAQERVHRALEREFHYIFSEFKYPGIPKLDVKVLKDLNAFDLGPFKIQPIELLHYKLPILGYRIGDFTYITDAKIIADEEKQKIKGSKILVLNALRRESHISHFTLEEAIALAIEIGAEQTYFTHLSHQMGKHAEVEAELPSGIHIAYDGLVLELANL